MFLEGRRKENGRRVEGGSEEGRERDGGDDEDEDGDGHVHGGGQRRRKKKTTKSVPGGKGLGGRWLFVSHDPVEVPEEEGEPLTRLFGLSRKRNDDTSRGVDRNTSRQQHARSVRFAFEPMVSDAMNNLFRESVR